MKVVLGQFWKYSLLGPADKIGVVDKWCGAMSGGWKPRILVLRNNILFYLEPDTELCDLVTAARATGHAVFDWCDPSIRDHAEPKGFLLVERCTIDAKSGGKEVGSRPSCFSICYLDLERQYLFAAWSATEMVEWIEALRSAAFAKLPRLHPLRDHIRELSLAISSQNAVGIVGSIASPAQQLERAPAESRESGGTHEPWKLTLPARSPHHSRADHDPSKLRFNAVHLETFGYADKKDLGEAKVGRTFEYFE
jgi:hypothetical protein